MPVDGYFDTVFASSGDKATVPDSVDPSGFVSYSQGYPTGYATTPGDPGSLAIERQKFNQLMFDVTSALQQYQQFGTPPFITSTMNGGSPFSYDEGARCVKDGVVYTSLEDVNEDTPPSAKWTAVTPVASGGTGRDSLTAYNLLIGNGASAVSLLAPAAGSGVPLVSQGSSANPAYTTAAVVGGGSGRTSSTAYAPILGGTSATSAHQSVDMTSSDGKFLRSNGTSAKPTFETPPAGITLQTVFDTFYPVGSYYFNESVSTNPATLFGFGTWVQVTDKFIVARGSTYTSTGGSATSSFSIAEANLPSSFSGNMVGGAVSWDQGSNPPNGSSPRYIGTTNIGAPQATNITYSGYTFTDIGSGVSKNVNTIPPYQAAYCWKRTA